MVKYMGHEEYFRVTQCLAGGTGISQLPEGPQEFQFSYQIPHTAPSSFEGETGSVTYRMTVHMHYPDPSKPKEDIIVPFQVVAPLDLNLGSLALKQPIEMEFEEVYGCDCICSPSPVSVRVRLPVSGYCPGQTIPISIEVQNDSSVEVRRLIFQLTSKECYRSNEPIAEHMPPERVLVTVKKGPVLGNSKRNFTCEMVVPDMIVPNLDNCGIIDLGYFFKTTIKLSGCKDDLQDESEICLGLVPLKSFTEGEYVHPMVHSLPKEPIPNPQSEHVSPGFVEPSNTPYSTKTQFDPFQNSPTPNKRPPGYVGSTEHISLNVAPTHEIGFVVPDGSGQQPYPNPVNPYPPYPGNMPAQYPYPGNPGVPLGVGAAPSAPPAYS
ncbi:hypothetical protein O3G_MSEX008424 [Manduca sexta]|uniref:Arrestin C-terminal-like domain-containing protein n=2 Tax=Manduca sexta TaxID=7130 RepID=A0A922CNY2_MANSE|nr:hypothetical protein O3G_MSEX008424 [Manduca sexta]